MAINFNVIVYYNDWSLPDIILLTQGYYQQHFGETKNEVFFKERGLLILKGPMG